MPPPSKLGILRLKHAIAQNLKQKQTNKKNQYLTAVITKAEKQESKSVIL